MTLLAYSRPFWPLFLHVLGAMTLFGAVLAALILALAGRRRETFFALLAATPAWVLTLAAGSWVNSAADGAWNGRTWLKLGMGIAGPGVLVLLAAIGAAYWWRRGGSTLAARTAAGLTGVYLLMLAVAWLAMSGKWA